MKYYKQYKDPDSKPFEISKEEARSTLQGWWTEESLDEIFNNDKVFSLYTPTSYVCNKTDGGQVLMAGFYGFS